MTENIVINNPSRKLEELLYKIGVMKYERQQKTIREYQEREALLKNDRRGI
jgi:hypothetical protein